MPRLSTALRNAVGDAFGAMTTCDIYSGSIPATGATAPTGTLLVSFPATLAWGGTTSGVNTLTVPLTSSAAAATGTAGYARIWDGGSVSMYCTVGTSGTEVVLSSLSIVSGNTVNITAATITVPAT